MHNKFENVSIFAHGAIFHLMSQEGLTMIGDMMITIVTTIAGGIPAVDLVIIGRRAHRAFLHVKIPIETMTHTIAVPEANIVLSPTPLMMIGARCRRNRLTRNPNARIGSFPLG